MQEMGIKGIMRSKAEFAVYYGSSKRKPDQQASQSMEGRSWVQRGDDGLQCDNEDKLGRTRVFMFGESKIWRDWQIYFGSMPVGGCGTRVGRDYERKAGAGRLDASKISRGEVE